MKYILFISLFFLSALFASGQRSTERSCLVGTTINGVGNVTSESCGPFKGMVCQTKMEYYQALDRSFQVLTIRRSCKTGAACGSNLAGNNRQCQSNDARRKRVRVCFLCCFSDDCNNEEELPPVSRDI